MEKNPLGKERMERIKSRIVEGYVDVVNDLIDLLTADGGVPAFQEKRSPLDVMANLIAMRDSQDPRYWQSTAAQAALRQLQAQYGMTVPQIGATTPPQPARPGPESAAFQNVLGTAGAPQVLGGY